MGTSEIRLIGHWKSFREVNPDNKEGVLYLEDEDGNDWYDIRRNFQSDTLKVLYDPNDFYISVISQEGEFLNPIGLSLAEIPYQPIPKYQSARFIDGEIVVLL